MRSREIMRVFSERMNNKINESEVGERRGKERVETYLRVG